MINLVLFEPEIPQNTGSVIRLSVCFGIALHLIEPFGFVWETEKLNRSAMDYLSIAKITKHPSWNHFFSKNKTKRLIVLKAHSNTSIYDFKFEKDDFLLFGKESIGIPFEVEHQCSKTLSIPMIESARSLNLAMSASIATSEAIRSIKAI